MKKKVFLVLFCLCSIGLLYVGFVLGERFFLKEKQEPKIQKVEVEKTNQIQQPISFEKVEAQGTPLARPQQIQQPTASEKVEAKGADVAKPQQTQQEYIIQIFSTTQPERALSFGNLLKKRGFNVDIDHVKIQDKDYWRLSLIHHNWDELFNQVLSLIKEGYIKDYKVIKGKEVKKEPLGEKVIKKELPKKEELAKSKEVWAIQIYSFENYEKAKSVIENLRKIDGCPVYLKIIEKDGRKIFQVRIGNFKTKQEAQSLAENLMKDKKIEEFFIIKE